MVALTVALVVARPGPLSESLHALLVALPAIECIHTLEDLHLALDWQTQVDPTLIFLDGDLFREQDYSTVQVTQARWPDATVIFFGNDVQQQEEAETAGVGITLLKGHPAPRLVTIIQQVLAYNADPENMTLMAEHNPPNAQQYEMGRDKKWK
jgi:DNA-binding NarL/FixJ family response regulator